MFFSLVTVRPYVHRLAQHIINLFKYITNKQTNRTNKRRCHVFSRLPVFAKTCGFGTSKKSPTRPVWTVGSAVVCSYWFIHGPVFTHSLTYTWSDSVSAVNSSNGKDLRRGKRTVRHTTGSSLQPGFSEPLYIQAESWHSACRRVHRSSQVLLLSVKPQGVPLP